MAVPPLIVLVVISCLWNQVQGETSQTGEIRVRKTIEEFGNTQCAFKNGTNNLGVVHTDSAAAIVRESGRQFINRCHSCYSFWSENPSTGEITVLGQGCWLSSDVCNRGACVAESFASTKSTKFCCCTGERCNVDFVKGEPEELPAVKTTDNAVYENFESTVKIVIYLVLVSSVVLISSGIAFLIYRLTRRRNKLSESDSPPDDVPPRRRHSSHHDLSSLQLTTEVLGCSGRSGTQVFRGRLDAVGDVAVKVFPAKQRQAFLNEKEIYAIVGEVGKEFVKLFGVKEDVQLNNIKCDFLMVMSLADHGSLQSFLKLRTISWPQLCSMLEDISRGLCALHAETNRKPSICHRDLNSRNILVRSDLSCCIADFGFSKVAGSLDDGLIEAGTIRYMAPELLEGVINLRDCDTALRQADVYALGLVFWELGRRCRDLYQGSEVPEFELAFEKEIGHNPTFEQMQVLVSKNKARPLFPEVWKDSNPAIQQLKETISDSWDHDGEARLTCFCVDERVRELSFLWDRYKNNRDPIEQPNNTQASRTGARIITTTNVFQEGSMHDDVRTPLLDPRNTVSHINNTKLDNVLSNQRPALQIQPYQGRNPCLERNLVDDVSVTSSLIQKSIKDEIKMAAIQSRQREEPEAQPPVARYVHPIQLNVLNDIRVSQSEENLNRKQKNLKNKNGQAATTEAKSNIERARRREEMTA